MSSVKSSPSSPVGVATARGLSSSTVIVGAAVGATVIVGAYYLWRRSAAASAAGTKPDAKDAPTVPLPLARLREGLRAAPSLFTFAPGDSVFKVTTRNGYLPAYEIPRTLPPEWKELDAVLADLPKLLHTPSDPNALADAVKGIPAYTIPDISQALLQALMRDYSVLVSAYLLEGLTKSGKPRGRVPANISVPFAEVAKRLGEEMIMSYDSYCLTNCASIKAGGSSSSAAAAAACPAVYDPLASDVHKWENLRLVRHFDGGPEETTFVTVHFEIESHTPALIASYEKLLNAVAAPDGQASAPASPRVAGGPVTPIISPVAHALRELRSVLERIVVSQLKMFNASDPRNYETFVRPWIFGWKGNPDFEAGVIFEGVSDKPTFLRGETGAQSTIIPSLDAILGITHKSDALRVMLGELEAYRPKPQRDFLSALRQLVWGHDTGAGGMTSSGVAVPATAGAAVGGAGTTGTAGPASSPVSSPPAAGGVIPRPTAAEPDGLSIPHAVRDWIRDHKDIAAARAFNECVALVWAFRDIHVTFASLYIGKYTSRETATGGTPYKPYLRKHRDESIAHQLRDFGNDAMVHIKVPPAEEFERQLDEVLKEDCPNGIPAFLLERHAAIIGRYPSDSLQRKAFPTWPRAYDKDKTAVSV